MIPADSIAIYYVHNTIIHLELQVSSIYITID